MISRTLITCHTCTEPITARIQVGHEVEQPISFPCPHCGTEIKLTLVLDEPPAVKVRWEENCSEGGIEGKVINIGAGFTITKDMLHQDFFFPSFQAPQPTVPIEALLSQAQGPLAIDSTIALGGLPRAVDHWRTVQRALRFHRTGQTPLMEAQLDLFWGVPRGSDETLDNAIFAFFMRFMAPSGRKWLDPLAATLKQAAVVNQSEFTKLANHYAADLKRERFENYSDIFAEYFNGYGEFNQTLVYLRNQLPLPEDAVATSSNFNRTKMLYGNAFEVLGSHLDVPAAINNILSGRAFDQMEKMDLKQFRSINKANRTNCFSNNTDLSWLVSEYDSTIRNASHHRWFKLDDARTGISYRSGGIGAVQRMTYAEYLVRCNQLVTQLMVLACLELLLLWSVGEVV